MRNQGYGAILEQVMHDESLMFLNNLPHWKPCLPTRTSAIVFTLMLKRDEFLTETDDVLLGAPV